MNTVSYSQDRLTRLSSELSSDRPPSDRPAQPPMMASKSDSLDKDRLDKKEPLDKKITSSSSQTSLPGLLQGVIESLIDGILILSDQGELIFANDYAHQICRQLTHNWSRCSAVPRQIWRSCQALLTKPDHYSPERVVIEDEIKTEEDSVIRVRARWLYLNSVEQPCLLVALEDQQQSAQYRAIAEAQKFGLTDREAEVWMLKRAGYTYKAVAAQLHIAEDTVKKHIKSIYAKRDSAEWLGEEVLS